METLKITLTKPALERLIGGDTELEIALRKEAVREIVSKKFDSIATQETWKLSHAMTKTIAEQCERVVEGYRAGTSNPQGRSAWITDYDTNRTLQEATRKAVEKYVGDIIRKETQEYLSAQFESDSDDKRLRRIVTSAVYDELEETVKKLVEKELKEQRDKIKDEALKLIESLTHTNL